MFDRMAEVVHKHSLEICTLVLLLMEKGVFTEEEWGERLVRCRAIQDQIIARETEERMASPEGKALQDLANLLGVPLTPEESVE